MLCCCMPPGGPGRAGHVTSLAAGPPSRLPRPHRSSSAPTARARRPGRPARRRGRLWRQRAAGRQPRDRPHRRLLLSLAGLVRGGCGPGGSRGQQDAVPGQSAPLRDGADAAGGVCGAGRHHGAQGGPAGAGLCADEGAEQGASCSAVCAVGTCAVAQAGGGAPRRGTPPPPPRMRPSPRCCLLLVWARQLAPVLSRLSCVARSPRARLVIFAGALPRPSPARLAARPDLQRLTANTRPPLPAAGD